MQKNKYNNFSEEEKKVKRDYGRNRYRNMTEDEKASENSIKGTIRCQKNKILIFLCSIKMTEKTLQFDDVEVNKKKFHDSKQPIALNLVDINQIVKSDKFKQR